MTEWIIQYLDFIIRLYSWQSAAHFKEDGEHYFLLSLFHNHVLLLNFQNQGHTEVSRPATYKIYGNENRLIW